MTGVKERLAQYLIFKKEKITFAESCTAGLLSATFCTVPGVSAVYDGGICSYANEVKEHFLGVPKDVLLTDGAVSARCAEAMARGAAKLFSADMAISVTGIAGPGGGSTEKPVGTVYFACFYKGRVNVRHCLFEGDRQAVREQSVEKAFALALETAEVPPDEERRGLDNGKNSDLQ